ncbi:phage antirepressor KilAC domain-containing protein [Nocardia gipuzkoensis]|uniref:phage antirepressor KilAC domain-containing protein n=1 Tax=Nocardia gipuzkoensis TaxID=2749991 RepID=UPI001E488DA4|nr:phage antirepressor KilAC domain-containing protein [Nocardia gipuzkoensis]UGT71860.1 phage antirepressor KilAC domain-containing protein [Nocardia gipuzkoensis]
MSDIARINDASPFDAIRRTRPDGSEYWLARDLCKLVQYETWRNFAAAIDRAKLACENSGAAAQDHFVGVGNMIQVGKGGRREVEDFELSRFGAYLTVMNGDPRKPEIAAAQAYFAIRTREAEVTALEPRRQAELVTKADLARMVLEIEEEKAVMAAALESAAPAVAYHDRYVANDDAATVKVWGAQHGLTQPQAFALLVDRKLIYRVLIGERWSETEQRKIAEYEYRAYAKYLGWFDLRPQHEAPRHHNGQVRQTLYVRQQFALQVAEKCGLSGQLRLDGGAA